MKRVQCDMGGKPSRKCKICSARTPHEPLVSMCRHRHKCDAGRDIMVRCVPAKVPKV